MGTARNRQTYIGVIALAPWLAAAVAIVIAQLAGFCRYRLCMGTLGRWAVLELGLQNFRGFERLDLGFETDLTVVVGRNGAGKTAVLDGIGVMLSTLVRELEGDTLGFAEADARKTPKNLDSRAAVAEMATAYPVVGSISAVVSGEHHSWTRTRRSARGRTSWAASGARDAVRTLAADARNATGPEPVLPVIAAYGVERLLGVRRASGEIASSRFGAFASALDRQSDLSRLSGFLEGLAMSIGNARAFGDEPPEAAMAQFAAIERACEVVLEQTGWHSPRWNPLVRAITLSHRDHGTLPLSHLSTGIRITAGLVIDLASRMARGNPGLGFGELLSEVPGVVLIDEIDLHLHPQWQQEIVGLLRRAFPLVQFIVSTHSPQVLSTVEARQIRVIDGDSVHSVDYANGLRSDIVLRSVLGTDPEPDVEPRRLLAKYLEHIGRGEGLSKETQALRAELDLKLGGVANVPELARADAVMAFAELDGGSE